MRFTDEQINCIRENWQKENWIEVIQEETGLKPSQISNKAQSMGLHRKKFKIYHPFKTFSNDHQPISECLKEGRCPHGGMIFKERIPFTNNYSLFCVHGGRWELPCILRMDL